METKRASYEVGRYGRRFWCVRQGADLVCVTLYKRGAREAARRLNDLTEREVSQ